MTAFVEMIRSRGGKYAAGRVACKEKKKGTKRREISSYKPREVLGLYTFFGKTNARGRVDRWMLQEKKETPCGGGGSN